MSNLFTFTFQITVYKYQTVTNVQSFFFYLYTCVQLIQFCSASRVYHLLFAMVKTSSFK